MPMKAGNSPIPGSTCGHSSCEAGGCKVRYCGPTTSIRDHHIMHAANGVTHVWAAAIVTGLAIVLTGAIAYSSVEASGPGGAPSRPDASLLMQRLDALEQAMADVKSACAGTTDTTTAE